MKIFVAIPTFDSKLPVQLVRCLLEEQMISLVNGDEMEFRFLPGCSHPAMGRNQLVHQFLESGFNRLVFLDSDITFLPGALHKIAKEKDDFVGGAYRLKQDVHEYPVTWKDGALWANEHGNLEVQSLPTGFLSLSRNVFEVLKEKQKDRTFQHKGPRIHCFFQMRFEDGALWGEDSYFCKEWREAGGKVWLSPEIALVHWDEKTPYPGHVGNWLKKINGIGQEAA